MKLGRVTGTVVSTVKYERYRGMKLLRVRHLDLELHEVGEELVALDAAHAGVGDIVLVNNDGGAAQLVFGDKALIASVTICGIIDSFTCQGKTIRCHG
ncbi:MAG: EutN/CcmL family microcompartment protein [Candidatus Limiplasma sp.]|nr:EutN/CcmL family microcompartment protein [Candidatus Limiplasma sp.]